MSWFMVHYTVSIIHDCIKCTVHRNGQQYSPPPITGTVTQVFPVKIVSEHLPLLFSGCKYGTKR